MAIAESGPVGDAEHHPGTGHAMSRDGELGMVERHPGRIRQRFVASLIGLDLIRIRCDRAQGEDLVHGAAVADRDVQALGAQVQAHAHRGVLDEDDPGRDPETTLAGDRLRRAGAADQGHDAEGGQCS